jgi:hypothetical protein
VTTVALVAVKIGKIITVSAARRLRNPSASELTPQRYPELK